MSGYPCRETSLLTMMDDLSNSGCRYCGHPGCWPGRRCHICQLEWIVDAYAARVDRLQLQVDRLMTAARRS